jgi:hypothetical protein
MIQRNERLSRALKGGEAPVAVEVAEKPAENETESEAKPEAAAESESALKEKEEAAAAATKTEDLLKSLDQQLVEWNQKLVSENKNLHQVIFCANGHLIKTPLQCSCFAINIFMGHIQS